MAGDASAYAELGLEPGADAAAVELAYKRLIKQHHPDREGGTATRAAELNRAYREIRASMAYRDPLELHPHFDGPSGIDRRWIAAAVIIAAGVGSLLLVDGPLASFAQQILPAAARQAPPRHGKTAAAPGDPMDQPLHTTAIDRAVRDASFVARTQDEIALARLSGACHHQLRNAPSIAQLDRCAAFDDAVVELQDRDPLRDRGPFSELAVTGRLWSGAAELSDDYLAIDGRLDRIRLRVELALAPALEADDPSAQPTRAPPPAGPQAG
jgi:hypothetical protein